MIRNNWRLVLGLIISLSTCLKAQTDSTRIPFFAAKSQPDRARLIGLSAGIGLSYSAATVGLWQAWYANYPRGRFRFFNDWAEWRQMDKAGHAFSTYFESLWTGQLYHWAGMPQKKAAWIGFGGGMLFQTTLEVLDGFSTQWGFSWWDKAFNVAGGGLYLGQELGWGEQRIGMKLSVHRPRYSTAPIYALDGSGASTSLKERGGDLYGTSFAELFFKEYNGQTIWLTVNPASFCQERPQWLPPWLNLAFGYGIENVFGGRSNTWTDAQGLMFSAPAAYPRYSQFFFSLDLDWRRLPFKHPFLRFVFAALNIIKLPFPTLEYNSLGQWRFRPLYF